MAEKSRLIIKRNRLPQLAAGMPGLLTNVVDKTRLDVERRTKENIVLMDAFDTGNMFNSAGSHMTGQASAEVEVGADYSVYVHEGYDEPNGHHVGARPFLAQAVAEVKADIPGEVRGKVEALASGGGGGGGAD